MDTDIAETLKVEQESEPATGGDELAQEEEASPRLISVGVMDIDKKLGGGLPSNTLTVRSRLNARALRYLRVPPAPR